jgi:hypothetical protein
MTMLGDFLRKLKARAKYDAERDQALRRGDLFSRLLRRRLVHHNDGATLTLGRERLRSGTYEIVDEVRLGPNHVHAFILHRDGGYKDLGVSKNLLTNIGRDVMASWNGGFIPAAQGSPATAVSASAVTVTGTPLTASNLATPQLGVASFRIVMPLTNIATAPVYANIISNTTSVLTIDQWWNAADGTPTTPAATNAFIIMPGGQGSVRFMGLTTDAGAASAADTVLATEITTSGGSRALATYAHTFGQATFTLSKAFSITGTLTAIHKMGLFCSLPQGGTTAALGGPVFFETVLNADASVINGDTLTVTDTVTLSG